MVSYGGPELASGPGIRDNHSSVQPSLLRLLEMDAPMSQGDRLSYLL